MKGRRITERTVTVTAAIGSVLIMVTVIANTYWASEQAMSSTNQAVSAVSAFYLESMADRRAKTITNLINNNFDYMEKAVDVIDDEKIESQEDLRATIGRMKSLLSLNRFALVDEDDVVYTQYTTYTGRSRHPFLANETLDGRMISTVFLYGSSKDLCLAIPIDIKIMGKQFKACFVQIDINDIVDLLALMIREVPVLRCIPQTEEIYRKQSWDRLWEPGILSTLQKERFPRNSGMHSVMISQTVKKET
jgi:hypothetical protein